MELEKSPAVELARRQRLTEACDNGGVAVAFLSSIGMLFLGMDPISVIIIGTLIGVAVMHLLMWRFVKP
jgi:hypothetical protein